MKRDRRFGRRLVFTVFGSIRSMITVGVRRLKKTTSPCDDSAHIICGIGENCDGHDMNLIRSRKRVADHGEVFTPAWMVEEMLDLVKGETERIDAPVS